MLTRRTEYKAHPNPRRFRARSGQAVPAYPFTAPAVSPDT